MDGQCRLCLSSRELVEGHVIPKFVFRWMKQTSTGFIRRVIEPNLRRQDGPTERIMCGDCDGKLGVAEKWFAETIFTPVVGGDHGPFQYDSRLAQFVASVLWRCAVVWPPSRMKKRTAHEPTILSATEEWRRFLDAGTRPSTFGRFHLFQTDLVTERVIPNTRFNRYLTRDVDATLVTSADHAMSYAKFARFILIGEITALGDEFSVGTLISLDEGILPIKQSIEDGRFGSFLARRSQRVAEVENKGISERQQELIARTFQEKASQLEGSDYMRSLEADLSAHVEPEKIAGRKIGRNELCPCGSGEKYKRCHGSEA